MPAGSKHPIRRFAACRSGGAVVEYALLASGLAMFAVGATLAVSGSTVGVSERLASALTSRGGPAARIETAKAAPAPKQTGPAEADPESLAAIGLRR